MSNFKIGQTVWVKFNSLPLAELQITEVCAKTFCIGLHRFNRKRLTCITTVGKSFLSKEDYENELLDENCNTYFHHFQSLFMKLNLQDKLIITNILKKVQP